MLLLTSSCESRNSSALEERYLGSRHHFGEQGLYLLVSALHRPAVERGLHEGEVDLRRLYHRQWSKVMYP